MMLLFSLPRAKQQYSLIDEMTGRCAQALANLHGAAFECIGVR